MAHPAFYPDFAVLAVWLTVASFYIKKQRTQPPS